MRLPGYDWVTGAARFLITRRSLMNSPDLIWLHLCRQYNNWQTVMYYLCACFFLFFLKETLLISNKVTAIEITLLRPAIIARLADTSHQNKLLIAHLLKAFWWVWSYLTLQWPRWQFRKMNQGWAVCNRVMITWHNQLLRLPARSDLRQCGASIVQEMRKGHCAVSELRHSPSCMIV